MISVISVNEKFHTLEPKKLVNLLIESKYTKGIEICVDPDNKFMMNYMDDLVNLCKENNILFQVHGDSSLDIDKQKDYLDLLSRYSKFFGYPINVVMHSLLSDNTEEEINKSLTYFNELIDYVDENKIRISVENLNDADNLIRLDKEEMLPIMMSNDKLYMTYDIGHDIADYGNITDLNPILIPKLSNVHIHSTSKYYKDGYDHKPIDDQSDDFEKVLKGILYLKHISYDGPIVFEYDLYQCKGDTVEEQVKSYIYSIDDTTEHII